MSVPAPGRAIARLALLLVALACAPSAFAYARICISADTLLFGEHALGTSTTATSIVESCGDSPWTFTSVALHPATGAAWHVDTDCRTGATLAPGQSCRIDVRFEPTVAGQTSGALWLHQTTSTPDQLVTFYGRGVDARAGTAAIAFEPADFDAGSMPVGVQGDARAIRVRNAGSASLTFSRLVFNGPAAYDFGPEFDAGGCIEGRTLAAGAACELRVRFTPGAIGTRRAQLVVDSPQLAALAILPIHGEGVATTSAAATLDVVEFHHPPSGQYFITADPGEIAMLDGGGLGPEWTRTGFAFKAYARDEASVAARPVCRFFGTPGVGPNSHFYTVDAAECDAVKANPHWIFEGVAFAAEPPVAGACPAGAVAVMRLWWAGAATVDSRHRYAVDAAEIARMQAVGWVVEGAAFCTR